MLHENFIPLEPREDSLEGVIYIPKTSTDMQIIKNLGYAEQYKSGGLGAILGLIISIAIPFVAPAIANFIGLSGKIAAFAGKANWVSSASTALAQTIGSTVGSAITGAALGAINAKIQGISVSKGALSGAIGGGLGGFVSAPSVPPATTALASASRLSPGPGAPNSLAYNSSISTARAAVAGAKPTVFDSIAAKAAKIGISKTALAKTVVQAGAQLAGQAIFAGEMSPQEREITRLQTEALADLKQRDEASFNEKLSLARRTLNQAEYFDPSNAGRELAASQKIASESASDDARRGASLSGRGFTNNDARRAELDKSRTVGSAYNRGYNTGLTSQTNVLGSVKIPSGSSSYAASLDTLHDRYSKLADRNATQAGNFTKLAGGLFGPTNEDEDK